MDYRELTEEQYYARIRTVVVGAEGPHARSQNVGDGMATIGYGYTFNRNNNVEIWQNAGIALTQPTARRNHRGDLTRPAQQHPHDLDPDHAATIDSQRMTRGNNPREVDSNDLLIGNGGDDILRAHRGNDV